MKVSRSVSFVSSFVLHLAIASLFLFTSARQAPEPEKYIEVGFGDGSGPGGGGGGGFGTDMEAPEEEPPQTPEPVVEKTVEKRTVPTKAVTDEKTTSDASGSKTKKGGFGNNPDGRGAGFGSGNGSGFGYDIDWGGRGRRRIYNYIIPEYPSGVNKELDIRVRFSILPDGSVGKIILLTKGDSKLENAAVSSLRQWRFEPLGNGQQQAEQFAVIVFPFRLQ